jgi:hypothetical protein
MSRFVKRSASQAGKSGSCIAARISELHAGSATPPRSPATTAYSRPYGPPTAATAICSRLAKAKTSEEFAGRTQAGNAA